MKMISPRLQQTALLGALLVTASLLASSRSLADTGGPGGEEFSVVIPGNPGPGPAGAPKTGGRGSQLLLQLRGSS